MLRNYAIIRESAQRIAEAADNTTDALADGAVEQEPHFTDRMLGAIEQSMRDFRKRGVRWSAKTLTDHGPGTQEKKYGADFMGVLNVDLPDYKMDKGFLAQSKLIRGGDGIIRGKDMKRLQEQCDAMLKLSPDSYVFIYAETGVGVVPAISVLGLQGMHIDLFSLYVHSVARFFQDHFESFIGDRSIQSPTPDTLERLQREYRARSAILLRAEPSERKKGAERED